MRLPPTAHWCSLDGGEDAQGPVPLTFLVRQAHSQDLPSGDGVFQKDVQDLRGDAGLGEVGALENVQQGGGGGCGGQGRGWRGRGSRGDPALDFPRLSCGVPGGSRRDGKL